MIQKLKNKNIKWWISRLSCTTLFLIIALFGYLKINFIIKGVEIKATLKQDDSSLILVSGKAEKATHLVLNGREIFIDKDGNFSEVVGLIPGFSVITLNAEDKFGKTAEKKFEIVYEGNTEAVALGNQIIN